MTPATPPGWPRLRAGGRIATVNPKLAGEVEAAGLLEPSRLERSIAAARGATGRGPTGQVELPDAEPRSWLVLRPVRRGGLPARLLGANLLGPRRPFREICAHAALHAVGAPVPEPALAVAWRQRGPFWRAVVGTLRIEDARDGLSFLRSAPDPVRLRRALETAGAVLRRFHDLGGVHADLHAKNLLVREAGDALEVLVIDLDRAELRPHVAAPERMAELMRLYRSLRKRRVLATVGERGCARFFRAYVAGDRALRAALLARLPWERRRIAVHALRYRS